MIKFYFAIFIRAFLYLISLLFPIFNNQIFISSFFGSKISCNPLYILKYLKKKHLKENINIIIHFEKYRHSERIGNLNIRYVTHRSIS